MSATATKSTTVSVQNAARTLGISEASVRRRIDDGSLAGFRLGSVRRVLRSELERLVAPERTEHA